MERVALVVDLEYDAHGPAHELFLVGLDPQRHPDQLGQRRPLGRSGALGRALPHPLREVVCRPRFEELAPASVTRPRPLNRRGPRQRIGHGIEQLPDQRGGGGGIEVVVRPCLRELRDAVEVALVEPVDPPARSLGVDRRRELAGRDEPTGEQRRPAEQSDARMDADLGPRPAEHGKRCPDRQRD